jgi:hypothetical protein
MKGELSQAARNGFRSLAGRVFDEDTETYLIDYFKANYIGKGIG